MSEIDEVLNILDKDIFTMNIFIYGDKKLPRKNLNRLKELGWYYDQEKGVWTTDPMEHKK
jgi:hypothetical protein